MIATYQKMTPIDNQSPDYIPVRMLEVELGQPLPTLSAFDEKKGSSYRRDALPGALAHPAVRSR